MEERLLVKETAKLQASFEGSRSRRWCWFGQTLNEDRVFVQGRVSHPELTSPQNRSPVSSAGARVTSVPDTPARSPQGASVVADLPREGWWREESLPSPGGAVSLTRSNLPPPRSASW